MGAHRYRKTRGKKKEKKETLFSKQQNEWYTRDEHTWHNTHLSSMLNTTSTILFCTTSIHNRGFRKLSILDSVCQTLFWLCMVRPPNFNFLVLTCLTIGLLRNCRIVRSGIKCIVFTFSFFFSAQAFGIERKDNPWRSLTNPKKLSLPSECLIQSWRTTWTGMFGLTPSSCYMKESSEFSFFPPTTWFKLSRKDIPNKHA